MTPIAYNRRMRSITRTLLLAALSAAMIFAQDAKKAPAKMAEKAAPKMAQKAGDLLDLNGSAEPWSLPSERASDRTGWIATPPGSKTNLG